MKVDIWYHLYGRKDDIVLEEVEKPERKSGRWIWDDEGYHCSECFFHAYGCTLECMDGTYGFCPHCGSKMKGDSDD